MKQERITRYRPKTKLKDDDFRIGTWNVLTMLQAGKLAEVTDELIRYRIKIAALQEIRWKDAGELKKKHYSLYYSGSKKEGHRGTGFWVEKNTRESVMGFEPINDRLCLMKLKGRFQNITILNTYAPTEESEQHEKDGFYDKLERILQKISKHDIVIVMGDFNAKIGRESFIKQNAGLHSLHRISNDNGIRLCSFAQSSNMWISSISFPHKDIHKHTWRIPGSNRGNQIDHILVNRRYSSSILDVRSFKGANCDSDHFLVIAKVRQRLSNANNTKGHKTKKWDTDKLKDDPNLVNTYQQCIENKLTIETQAENIDPAPCWKNLKSAIIEAATESIGTKESKQNHWYDNECSEINNIKNDAYKRFISKSTRQNYKEYKEKRKAAKKMIKAKKRNFLKETVKQIEEKAKQNRTREMYRLVKQQTKPYQPRLKTCRNKEGEPLIIEREILERWKEYFNDLYLTESNAIEESNYQSAEIQIRPIELEEVRAAIRKLKNCKASGEDEITAELFKYGGEVLTERIHALLSKIWEIETIPEEWLTSIIVPVHKKGDKTVCENYRGISLLNTIYKVLTNVIFDRISPYAEEILADYQCGFRRNKSTTDQCFILSQIFEKHQEYQIGLHCLFIDYRQAFDSIHRNKVERALLLQGIPRKYVNLVKQTLVNTSAKVKVHGLTTDPIEINSGVRQGDALSTVIFNLMLNFAIKEVNPGGTIFNKACQICAYADDIVILARNMCTLKETFSRLEKLTEELGLKINVSKTKYLKKAFTTSEHRVHDLMIGGYNFEHVDNFVYLGVRFNTYKDTEEAVLDRIQAANRTYFANVKFFKSRLITRSTKLRLYKSLVRPVLSYGCEVWKLKANELQLIEVFERKILRRIFGPVQTDNGEYRIRFNHELEDLINGQNIRRFVKAQRLKWLGHIIRMPSNATVQKVFNTNPDGRRRRGRPRRRWLGAVEDDLIKMGINNYRTAALDREIWGKIAEDALAHTEL